MSANNTESKSKASVPTDVDTGKSKDELEKVDLSRGSQEDTEPKLVNLDNGTQSFEDSSMEKVTNPEIVQGAASMDNLTTSQPQVYVDNIETPVVVREKRIIDERLTGINVDNYLEDLKKRNPKKYEAKKAELAQKSAEREAADEAAKKAEDAEKKAKKG